MSRILVAATPVNGHTGPLLRIAAHLVELGHEVAFLGGARFAAQAAATGAVFHSLPPEADYDDRDFDASFPSRRSVPPGPAQVAWDIMHVFGDPLPSQLFALHKLLAEFPATTVIHDNLFLGGVALALTEPAADRPTVLSIGISPLGVPSRDTAPHLLGLLPPVDEEERARYAALAESLAESTRPVADYLAAAFSMAGARLPSGPTGRVWTEAADHYLQLTVPGFEYPRSDLPAGVSFVGALPLRADSGGGLPDWWPELSRARAEGRRIVVVTQGTFANADLTELIAPTVRALAERRDVLVVAATARPDGARVLRGALSDLPGPPANSLAADYVPFDALLPFADLLVTNGGYGGVQAALGHGVPLVVAGETEDKPEVAARVEWSGTGVNLRTARPSVEQVGEAVDRVLGDPRFRERANVLRAELAEYDALSLISARVAAPDRG
ncbi:nucleotide disphospho-sugar-binding domain-containing protein [Kitasatospora brasiliensis]|uniref:nucleotide disphospho-sugar-binding domain-containing protein n=1 Tax=Kitasatospora brasiliensis TaxID=3058040 RepID=UPI00292CE211|nr:nucleotide disphospho-sugar-binding domain-containing protein [Kitasatospora sp. K002]